MWLLCVNERILLYNIFTLDYFIYTFIEILSWNLLKSTLAIFIFFRVILPDMNKIPKLPTQITLIDILPLDKNIIYFLFRCDYP